MSGGALNAFLQGGCAALSLVAALFFARSWRSTRERLFLGFAVAFVLLALNWIGLNALTVAEGRHGMFAVRLVAFLVILAAIADKNRPAR